MALLIHLCIAYDCFHTTSELGICDRDCQSHKASSIYYLALYSKSLSNHGSKSCHSVFTAFPALSALWKCPVHSVVNLSVSSIPMSVPQGQGYLSVGSWLSLSAWKSAWHRAGTPEIFAEGMNMTVECPGMWPCTRNKRALGGSRANGVVTMWAPRQDERVRRARDKQRLLWGKQAFEGKASRLRAARGQLEVGKRGIP